ncbi:MAG: L-serine ammonia-lyase, iron-sulfur-dependent, subunit alpha [Firmicutes bacterium]|nr:L-serine ammonia-lyase, iron-sulfur-dependent, subunit alpha [Bacillota bacterium]
MDRAQAGGVRISDVVLEQYGDDGGRARALDEMKRRLHVMQGAVRRGLEERLASRSGLTGGAARRVETARARGGSVLGDSFSRVIARSLAVAEVNACMGRIVAAPTAGSCGVIPGVLITLAERLDRSEQDLVMALFTAAAVGGVIATRATVSGAEGGCQAECGAAAAMAAAAGVELCGGTPAQSAHAAAISIKGTLGLVCDPIAGLVEVPCVKRNALAAANSVAAIEMALAGVESVVPVDEVIDTMKRVGRAIPESLRETSLGGLATTPTALEIARRLG